MEEIEQQFDKLSQEYMYKVYMISRKVDQGELYRDRAEELMTDIIHDFHLETERIFDQLSWEEQIHFCIYANKAFLLGKLDEAQLTTFKLLQ